MRYQNIHQDFKRQFGQECLVYTCRQELPYNNMLYRQYRGTEKEIDIMGPLLEAETSDMSTIKSIIYNLQKRDMPALGRLLCYAQDVRKMMDAYRLGEGYAAPYYSRLLDLLNGMCSSANSFRVDVQDNLLNRLETFYERKLKAGNVSDFNLEDLEQYCIELEEYLCSLREYYLELSFLSIEELGDSHGIALLSPIQEYLQTLAEMTEAVLYTTECTQIALEEWCYRLEVWELQEMYN